uniref:ankyrin repeat domain-containing protein 40-like isoform X2 n=1 Tax=Myxine glutinosa TaxID=7769 RepID=UPI00358F3E66
MECEQTTKEVEDDEESLREAACIGDMDLVRRLVDNGVSVNSQNDMNGWSCLHWACKRNRTPIVAYLLEAGADAEALTAKGERAVDLTHNPDIRAILGCESSANDIVEDSSLPITPNYISNPPFPYSAPTENGVAGNPDRELKSPQYAVDRESGHDDSTSPQLAGLKQQQQQQQQQQHQGLSSRVQQYHVMQPGIVGGMPSSYQPVFLHTAFPFQTQGELILKVRVQDNSRCDNDFIEMELDRQELTYSALLHACCVELHLEPTRVEKIRKLPNTLLRRDKEVARLTDYQELELVVGKHGSLFSQDILDCAVAPSCSLVQRSKTSQSGCKSELQARSLQIFIALVIEPIPDRHTRIAKCMWCWCRCKDPHHSATLKPTKKRAAVQKEKEKKSSSPRKKKTSPKTDKSQKDNFMK